ncbi:MAG: glycoside hydrolase family 76 protein [Agriterribacter sp.]
MAQAVIMINPLTIFIAALLAVNSEEMVLPSSTPGQRFADTAAIFRQAAQKLRTAIQQQFYHQQTGYYTEFAEPARNEKPASYLWPLCALIQADHEEEILLKKTGLVDKTLEVIKRYYDQRPPHPGYASYPPPLGGGDRFYDDNQWIGIAVMDAWQTWKKQEYLAIGKDIYHFMMTGYDTASGGGLYWEEGKPTKNTCSNGPGIILALQLYNATRQQSYLDTALLLYRWVIQHLRSPEGLYWDNIHSKSMKVDSARYSYNTGTMVQAGLYLYEITGDKQYLQQARESAKAALHFFYSNPLLKDDYWFNAVLLRAYQHLLKHDKDRTYINAFAACIRNEISARQRKDGLFEKKEKTVNLVNQAGMLEILNRLAYIEKVVK